MSTHPPAQAVKVVIIGDSAVGKTSLLLRFTEDTFQERIEIDAIESQKDKFLNIDGKIVKLALWDTLGQERFRDLTISYFRDTNGIIIVFDVGSTSSFETVPKWIEEANSQKCKTVPKLLVGNKLDLKERQVSFETAHTFAEERQMKYIETSAMTGENVTAAFETMARECMKQMAVNHQKKSSVDLDVKTMNKADPSSNGNPKTQPKSNTTKSEGKSTCNCCIII